MVLDFYPHFKDLAWLWKDGQVVAAELQQIDRSQLKASKHPFLLYLKAHFVGHSLIQLQESKESLVFKFSNERSFSWNFENKEWNFSVADRKDYLQRLPNWASYDKIVRKDGEPEAKVQTQNAAPEKSKATIKFDKLRLNVEADLAEANQWLQENSSHIQFFFESPQLWGADLNRIPSEHHDWIQQINQSISFSGSRKNALDSLKKLLARFERKKNKAQERLTQLGATLPPSKETQLPRFKDEKKPDKALPKKVELMAGVEAIIGRKALENDELFRKAQSRDLWLHVRGQRGAHVWIRRGQKGFGAKGEIPELALKKAAELAAKYSKASGAWISVDYTERRFLKKLKGADAGSLQVLQSKTIFVSINEE